MKVLSLFDGMSCGQIALNEIGIKPDEYYASEINATAIKVTAQNFPDTKFLGDVTNWPFWQIPWSEIDLVLAGSPCQGFSLIGKQAGFEDPRSALFISFLEVLSYVRYLNPKVRFLLENVRMSAAHIEKISSMIGEEPEYLNSKDYSACSRPRLYWFNWDFKAPPPSPQTFKHVIDFHCSENIMPEGWQRWWAKNSERSLSKSFSKIVEENDQGIAMVARQYANWNGNFIKTPCGRLRKPTKKELALLVGAPENYFSSVSQRAAEEMTGNGWTVPVICEILKQGGVK